MSEVVIETMLVSAMSSGILLLLVWLLSLWLRDVSIIDIVWGMGFIVIAWTAYIRSGMEPPVERSLFLPVLSTIWGLRLSTHLLLRNMGHAEDYRYRSMRDYWGENFWWISLFTVFTTQWIIMWIVSLPLQTGTALAKYEHPLIWVGVVVWGVGLFFEAVGDWQLTRFKADKSREGEVLDSGLWRYTRHPNYFGDFLVWWGIYLVSVGLSGVWWTIVGPVVMSIFLMKVSGVTLLEKKLSESKPKYREYVQRTNAFFPGPRHEPAE